MYLLQFKKLTPKVAKVNPGDLEEKPPKPFAETGARKSGVQARMDQLGVYDIIERQSVTAICRLYF